MLPMHGWLQASFKTSLLALRFHVGEFRRTCHFGSKCCENHVSGGFFDGRSIMNMISAQHRNSPNHGPKTRFSCASGRTRKLRGSISSGKGLRKLKFSESLALNMQVEPAMYVYVSSQPFNHNLEALNEATKMFSGACLLGPWDRSCK